MGRQYMRSLWEDRGLFGLYMLVDVISQRVESGLKHRIVVGLLQGLNAFLDLLMILPRLTDQPLSLLIGLFGKDRVKHRFFQQHMECQFGKDMLGNDLLQVRIGGVRILLEERAYLAVIRCEQRNSIVRLIYGIVAVGMGMLCHGRVSLHVCMCGAWLWYSPWTSVCTTALLTHREAIALSSEYTP